jgi:DNA (cytosine-5)-methyltransferase 1
MQNIKLCFRGRSEPKVFPIATNNKKSPYEFSSNSGQVGVKVVEATKKGYAEAQIGDSINFSLLNSKTRRGRVGHGVAQTLDTASNQATIQRQPLKFLKRNQRKIDGDYSFTVDSANTGGIRVGLRIRRLTPTECERLMSWPDNWTQEPNISDTQRYKMCGNGVVSEVVKNIVERLYD